MNLLAKTYDIAWIVLFVFFGSAFSVSSDNNIKNDPSRGGLVCMGSSANISWCFIDLPGVDHREASPEEFVDSIKGIQIETTSGEIVPKVVVGKMNRQSFTHKQVSITVLELLTRFAIQTGNQVVIDGNKLLFGEVTSESSQKQKK